MGQNNTPPPSETPPASQTDGQPPAEGATGQNGTPSEPLTVEEVENQWKHRVSQKDRAHAAAEQALRDENDALKRRLETATTPRSQSNGQSGTGGSNDPEVETLREQLAEQRRATETEQQARIVEQRKAKYPALAREVGEAGNSIFTTADEATLARLNSKYDDGSSTGTFASATPRRTQAPPAKALGEMNKAELEAELQRSIERGDLKRPQ